MAHSMGFLIISFVISDLRPTIPPVVCMMTKHDAMILNSSACEKGCRMKVYRAKCAGFRVQPKERRIATGRV